MRIIHAISSISRVAGGPSYAVVAMARAAAALGHDVTIHATDYLSPEGPSASEVAVGPGRVRTVVHKHLALPQLTLQASTGMARALSEEIPKADVVHLHSMYLFHDYWVRRVCLAAKVPYIFRPHGTLDPFIYNRHRFRKRIVEVLFQDSVTSDATLIHYTSDQEQELAQPYVFGRPGVVVPLGVDLARFAAMPPKSAFTDRHPETRGRKIVLFLSRVSFKKGLEILIPAFAAATTSRDDMHLVIAGPDDGFEAQARSLVQQNGIEARTTFTGHLNAERVLEALGAADVFALPSHTENFGIAAAEAIAAGVPSILSEHIQIAPPAEADGACLSLPREQEMWTDAMLRLLSNTAEASDMSRHARAHAAATYSWDAIALRLVAMYETAIGKRHTAS
jgi:glycosyltransferase involved in cell wall biosynthesis